MTDPVKQTTPPKPPNGLPADARIINAIINLCDQFAVCGLEVPVAILVAPGQAQWIDAMVRRSNQMLIEDKASKELRVWGVPIREAERAGT